MKNNVVLKPFGKYNVHAVFRVKDGYEAGQELSFDVPDGVGSDELATRDDVRAISREVAEEVFEDKARGYR